MPQAISDFLEKGDLMSRNCYKHKFKPVEQAFGGIVKVAAVQTNPLLMEKDVNLRGILDRLDQSAKNGAQLVVFPECALTGYCFNSKEEAMEYAETIPGPSVDKIVAAAGELSVYTVIGLLEKDGDELYNTNVLVGPDGLIGMYRKTHVIYLGVDRFVTKGNLPYKVYPTKIGCIGLTICYDMRFPEISRILALQGADIIANSTSLPVGADSHQSLLIPTRALENRVYVVAADRVGEERSNRFIGRSIIVDVGGKPLAEASGDNVEIIYADIDLSKARAKKSVIKPGEYEMDIFGDRRPELYQGITIPTV
ncbi:carbon-nitrogen hydrolase family protein [Desulfallas sp. Bu1-1]|uniref:carbon-nitrogen hydrolase family protein n=1 Tax=Desulfallas sp. Bu1-1 TaxID=2787620 RepID=UPI00189E5E1B|nr:carbon-nitrogen hydrolase family protein [Desulfallas sp. Bu1-1]MBF7083864.1 carbon-nitrogen hydrolase family protein [Desulfallas sp. Bu1-1]